MHDKQKALEVIEFVQFLKLVDDFHGQQFTLLDWQHDLLWNVYGKVNKDKTRQYKTAYLEVPKKNGKTSLIAALALYHLTMDGNDGQIYCCAADREQASLVYKAAVGMRDQCEDLKGLLKLTASKKEITNKETGTTLKVLSSEAYTKHGLNPSIIIFDELHSQPNRELWDVMTFGSTSTRKEPLLWVITTAGDDPDRHSVAWEQHEYARKVADGEIDDKTYYAKIFGAPDAADIYNEKLWYECNPSLGHTISIDTVRQEAFKARNSESAEKLFRWLRLNQWVSTKKTSWLPLEVWDNAKEDFDKKELIGCKCYGGIDLSSVSDLTGICLLFPPQKNWKSWRMIFHAFIPGDNMNERVRIDRAPYDKFEKQGYLTATHGDVIDYEYIKSALVGYNKLYQIEYIGYDPYNSSQLVNDLTKGIEMDGKTHVFNMIEVSQRTMTLSPPMKEIEVMLRKRTLTHNGNPVARWCFGNTVVVFDGNQNMKPMKNKSREKIDLTLALIDAMFVGMKFENTKVVCPYSRERGIIVM